MAKKKTTPSKKEKVAAVVEVKKPDIAEGEYSFCMTIDEMLSMIQILTFSKEMFNQMSINCLKEGDEKSAAVYAARVELSQILYRKISQVARIGEPLSRDIH